MDQADRQEKVSEVEVIKRNSRHLRGSIAEELANGEPSFTEESRQLLKFHGVYQQDDRDLRAKLRKEGKDKHYIMMVRARIPGGVLTPDQYLQFDRVTDWYGGGTLRVTTRQTIQLHYVLKRNLKQAIRALNDVMVTTLNGCGDQVRNVIACAAPVADDVHRELREDVLALVDKVGAKTRAYHEIWLDGEPVAGTPDEDEEPLYKDVYLPRKFKFGFAIEGDNCIDVYSNDVGIVAHPEGGHVKGYTILVGGGMGRTASMKQTYPRLASPLGYVPRADLVDACVAVLTAYRDYGNRANRRRARLKYLIDERGLDWFRGEVQSRFGRLLADAPDLVWQDAHDHYGWHPQGDGRWYLGLFVENGRIKDEGEFRLKTALRAVVERWRPTVHLTTQQNVILAGFAEADRPEVEAVLRSHGVRLAHEWSRVMLNSMACVGLPTCGLSVADSERALPQVLPQLERIITGLGLADEDITIRMTGCPNGCARPYISDIAFVGRSPNKYDVFLGGDFLGRHLNKLYKELVPLDQLAAEVEPVLAAFAREREPGERFGDFVRRKGVDYFRELNVGLSS
ncbi:MAG: NADPH-dependent assimilatory sulfite reductase hemoprotein subunit [Alicyclobacillaceae bacterium]|nr:NADPH-dependent assimilatory sulfite reductase hemoprotein subunit [Alicyclobacillaceae bacterium]